MTPLPPINLPDHTGQGRDLRPVWTASSLMAVEHILIARNVARKVHRRMGHMFYYRQS